MAMTAERLAAERRARKDAASRAYGQRAVRQAARENLAAYREARGEQEPDGEDPASGARNGRAQ